MWINETKTQLCEFHLYTCQFSVFKRSRASIETIFIELNDTFYGIAIGILLLKLFTLSQCCLSIEIFESQTLTTIFLFQWMSHSIYSIYIVSCIIWIVKYSSSSSSVFLAIIRILRSISLDQIFIINFTSLNQTLAKWSEQNLISTNWFCGRKFK